MRVGGLRFSCTARTRHTSAAVRTAGRRRRPGGRCRCSGCCADAGRQAGCGRSYLGAGGAGVGRDGLGCAQGAVGQHAGGLVAVAHHNDVVAAAAAQEGETTITVVVKRSGSSEHGTHCALLLKCDGFRDISCLRRRATMVPQFRVHATCLGTAWATFVSMARYQGQVPGSADCTRMVACREGAWHALASTGAAPTTPWATSRQQLTGRGP